MKLTTHCQDLQETSTLNYKCMLCADACCYYCRPMLVATSTDIQDHLYYLWKAATCPTFKMWPSHSLKMMSNLQLPCQLASSLPSSIAVALDQLSSHTMTAALAARSSLKAVQLLACRSTACLIRVRAESHSPLHPLQQASSAG